MNHFRKLSTSLLILTTIFMFTIKASAEESQQDADLAALHDQVQLLQNQVVHLSKQVLALSRNQKNIAKQLGLGSKPKKADLRIGNSASFGSEDAQIAIIEFTDLHCPFCKKFHNNTLPELKAKYIESGRVRFASKHSPIEALHKNARLAALALECTIEQDKYSQAKDWLFDHGSNFTNDTFDKFISELNLVKSKFTDCTNNPESSAQIDKDIMLAKQIGATATPSFAIGLHKDGKVSNWKVFPGAKTLDFFDKAIDRLSDLASVKD